MLWLTNSTVRPCLGHVAHLAQALALELGVAHRQHLVHHQDLRLQMGGHREGQAQVHAAGIALDGRVDELLHFGEVHDLVELALDLGAAHAQDGAVEVDVFPAGQFRMEAGAHLEQGADPAVDLGVALGGVGDPREDLQQGALARAVAPDHPQHLPLLHVEAHVSQSPNALLRSVPVRPGAIVVPAGSQPALRRVQRITDAIAQSAIIRAGDRTDTVLFS